VLLALEAGKTIAARESLRDLISIQ